MNDLKLKSDWKLVDGFFLQLLQIFLNNIFINNTQATAYYFYLFF
jgi:hypothetical protein